ncbi:hypothetical protein CcCBS67573_g10289 [Chytriomyces confervae]|uniref:HPt domain-containing protein n=1 Tax=Chytriomyces confervae TaxID=246404 RepID=A0A507D6E6_9FUNG|nr:hypothetical protein CcCBS67573_g10289 [Chytriomyces confervae]
MSASNEADVVDRSVFDGLLDMDDDPVRREFSRDIAQQYCQQTKGALAEIQHALHRRHMPPDESALLPDFARPALARTIPSRRSRLPLASERVPRLREQWNLYVIPLEKSASKSTHNASFSRNNDIESLGRLGHFQKGSSAALGLRKVRNTCEQIQHLGRRIDKDGNALRLSDAEILEHLDRLVRQLFVVNREAENWLREFFKF